MRSRTLFCTLFALALACSSSVSLAEEPKQQGDTSVASSGANVTTDENLQRPILIADEGEPAKSPEVIPPPPAPAANDTTQTTGDTVAPFYSPNTGSNSRPPSSPKPWKGIFFDNDFSYKNDPGHTHLFGEEFKDMPLGFVDSLLRREGSRLSFGGELRHRYMDERNRLRPGGPAQSTYQLWRWRNYLDYHMNDNVRVYVEMLDASIFGEDLPATPIDINRWNIQNAFVDISLLERDGKPIVFRFGRQELLYGKQRLVSPLDWGNTRRNFEGFKIISKGDVWDIDAFATRPVNTAAGNLPLSNFDNERDHADYSRTFSGVYATYHGIENNTLDFYWLWLREQQERAAFPDGSRQTIGARWAASRPVYNSCHEVARLWTAELEGGYQFGHDAGLAIQAGFFTGTLAHTWKNVTWTPTITGLYYWGSGDRDASDGKTNTFSVLFPLGHAYWGLIDNLSGQNLKDYSIQGSVKPTKKLTGTAAMHWFNLDQGADILYTASGAGIGTAGTGTDVGKELDLVANYAFNPNFGVQVGYLWFWNGTFIDNNFPRNTATQFYVQTTLRY